MLDFLFSLRLLLYAAVCCVCVFFVYRFAFYSKLFTWAISCFFVCFVIICFLLLGSECKNRKRPLNVFLIQMICLFCTRFASCFISNYSFLLDQLLLVVFYVFAFFCVLLLMLFCWYSAQIYLWFALLVKYSTHRNALNFINRVNETDSPLNRTTNISRLCAMLVLAICFINSL